MVTQVSGPLPELCYGWFKDYRIGNAIHDRLVAGWLTRHVAAGSRGIFHGFQESCARSLTTARHQGLTALLESTLPPSTMPLVAAEYRRLGVPWAGPTQPSAELLDELPRADAHVAQSAFAEQSPSDRAFSAALKSLPAAEDEVETYLAKQVRFDPDLWIIESEDRAGRHFLDQIVK